MPTVVPLDELASSIEGIHRREPGHATTLVGLTGIDGCRKGYIAAILTRQLVTRGHRVASLNVDGWLNLPATRFSDRDPAEHFYRHAIRFDEMFQPGVAARANDRLGARGRGTRGGDRHHHRPHTYAFSVSTSSS